MYLPAAFKEERLDVLQALLEAHPLATLVVNSDSGLLANHVPLEWVAEGPHGTLRGHIARANPLWQAYRAGEEVLAIFHGPQGYITPNFYASKAATGKVVPTWNYAVVHARGPLKFTHDAAWLKALVARLTGQHEAASAKPWGVDDAPVDYTQQMLGLIVGLELPISSLVGKFKLSQNRSEADRAGVREGLERRGTAADAGMLSLLEP